MTQALALKKWQGEAALASDVLAQKYPGVLGRVDKRLPRRACRLLAADVFKARPHRLGAFISLDLRPIVKQHSSRFGGRTDHPVTVYSADLNDHGFIKLVLAVLRIMSKVSFT